MSALVLAPVVGLASSGLDVSAVWHRVPGGPGCGPGEAAPGAAKCARCVALGPGSYSSWPGEAVALVSSVGQQAGTGSCEAPEMGLGATRSDETCPGGVLLLPGAVRPLLGIFGRVPGMKGEALLAHAHSPPLFTLYHFLSSLSSPCCAGRNRVCSCKTKRSPAPSVPGTGWEPPGS